MSELAPSSVVDALSVWRSPLDKVALSAATSLAECQPRCSIGPNEDLSAMTIYNYQYYVTASGNTSTGLSEMLSAMNPNYLGYVGGVAFIRQEKYTIATIPTGGFSVPDQCNIVASGTGGSDSGNDFYHFVIQPTGGLTFLSCSSSAYTAGGIYFQGIAFQWSLSTDASDTCISAATQNCTAVRCTFTDCPVAFYAQAPGCTLKHCTIFYHKGMPASAIAVTIASSQCAVIGPGELEQESPGAKNGPASCTCISIHNGADHALVTDSHISDWSTGIDFSRGGGSTNTQIRNCEIQSYITAINIVNGDGVAISGVKVVSCMLTRSNDSYMSEMATPVVLINPGSYGNDAISDVTLLGCTVYMMGNADYSYMAGQHGLEIVGGTNIKVLGGTYSNNNPASGAGIAITGACGDVQIIGANLQPSYANGTGGSTTQCQAYGLLVTSNPAPNMTILVRDCDMRGYDPMLPCGTSAIYTSGVTRGLYINDCLGYNDQNAPLTATSLTSPSMSATCSTPYFGPSVITFTNTSPVTLNIDGQVLTLSHGVVFLASPYDSFFFNTAPTGFTWYGK
jgi:hypothetical protein